MSIAQKINGLELEFVQPREQYLERRGSIRIDLDCAALIRLDSTLTFPARLRDISLESAQVICDAKYALMVDPSGNGEALNERRPLELAFGLTSCEKYGSVGNSTSPEEQQVFRTRCRVKYCSRVAQSATTDQLTQAKMIPEKMVMGLKFLSVDFSMLQKLDQFLENHRSM